MTPFLSYAKAFPFEGRRPALEPSPLGEGGRRPDEGQVSCSCPFAGPRQTLHPHQSAGGAADSFPRGGSPGCRKRCAHPLAPSARGLRPQAVGGENCTAARNISDYGKVLSLRPFGAPPSQREVFRHAGLPHRGKLSAKRTDEGRAAGNIPFTGNSANFALIRPRFARPPSPDGEGFLFFIASPPARLRARRGAPRASKRRSASGCGQTAAGG